jgi:hypothetical protein
MTHCDLPTDTTDPVQPNPMCDRDRTGPFYGPCPSCHGTAPGRTVTNVTEVTDVTCPFYNTGRTGRTVTRRDIFNRCHGFGIPNQPRHPAWQGTVSETWRASLRRKLRNDLAPLYAEVISVQIAGCRMNCPKYRAWAARRLYRRH